MSAGSIVRELPGPSMVWLAEPLITSLERELDTSWLPDAWSWADLRAGRRWSPSELEAPTLPLRVPLIGKGPVSVPVLGERTLLELTAAALEVLADADPKLRDGVVGYRLEDDKAIEHYRGGLRRRVALEETYTGRASFVACSDIASFFRSTSVEGFERAGVFNLGAVGHQLHRQLTTLQAALGYALPEGYVASRALANLLLAPLDEAVGAFPFTRWVDDHRVFVTSEDAGRTALSLLGDAAAEIGLRLSPEKSAVRSAAAVSANDVVSVIDHAREVVDAASLQSPNGVDERALRHLLRLSTQHEDASVLEHLSSWAAADIPATAIPRLASACAHFQWTEAARILVKGLVELEDDLTAWRRARLAYLLWSAPQAVVGDALPALLNSFESVPASRPIVLRVLVRLDPKLAGDLAATTESLSGRCRTLLAEELVSNVSIADPPLNSFL